VDLGTLGPADVEVFADALELRRRVDGADVGVLVERVADDQRLHALLELVDDFIGDDSCTNRREPAQHTCPG
jgi:hypothetical protein